MSNNARNTAYAPAILPRGLIVLVLRVLRPLARILLRNGMSCLEFEEISRWVFVDVSMRESEFALPNRNRPFKSRAAILTGLSRKEVMRLADLPPPEQRGAIPSRNRAIRVVAGWMTHNDYVDDDGQPRELAINKGQHSFADLVRLYSGDVPHRAILDELLQNGLLEKLSNDKLRLVPGDGDQTQLDAELERAGACLEGLLDTLDHNQQREHGCGSTRIRPHGKQGICQAAGRLPGPEGVKIESGRDRATSGRGNLLLRRLIPGHGPRSSGRLVLGLC